MRALKRNNITLYGYGGHDDVIARGIGERAKWLARAQFRRSAQAKKKSRDSSGSGNGSENDEAERRLSDGLKETFDSNTSSEDADAAAVADKLGKSTEDSNGEAAAADFPTEAMFDVIKVTISKLFSEQRTDKLSMSTIASALTRANDRSIQGMQASTLKRQIQTVLAMLEEDNRVVLNGDDVYLM